MTEIITDWTREERYRPYQEWESDKDYIKLLKKTVKGSKWRNHFHLDPETGLLNDPNGFSYFNGKWHLFYQAFPYGASHGLKSWAKATSDDLVHWQYEGLTLLPDSPLDSHGVYSGSALEIDDQLFLFYTGNVRNENWERFAFQNGAWLSKDGEITKLEQPLIDHPAGYTDHFRDPMIFEYQSELYMVIGAQDLAENGHVLLYKAENKDIKQFKLLNQLKFTDKALGFMVECPNLVFINQKPVLLFCPQGLSKNDLSYQNIFPNTYVTAESFNPEKAELVNPSEIYDLDEGFDVYATQAFNAPDGRVLSVSWIGLPDISYPTDAEGWASTLSLVKELTLVDGKLHQYPVKEMLSCRQEIIETPKNNSYEAEFKIAANQSAEINFYASKTNGLKLSITNNGIITLDRSRAGQTFAEAFGTTRSVQVNANKEIIINAFVDQSVIEIFINNGEKVLTARVFPAEDQTGLEFKGIQTKTIYKLGL
ncbi:MULTISPECIES: sucrose-6-phosphate hydrolase [unclassified Enterococcus]|uniref:sucrose-6-phosphate hydrolase n=1 Tax=unclassified Enterococcus TaxID=2608891 RepID=UPI001557EFCB|nr:MULTISPECIES: sucrose-6-phosphate hydrolase [unclassified Enterococcus]MBS7576303.1 sucrose-6-phosphate hydrolase [Enterococcus sp. MMGLQ5-2]MBS7583536.1 sucrose-6-phosphate hydrolase [Enterococcus sp. MMGLQ5-1]NPD11398.1 sucrose-6-phosphate hydrolase [Enterococcus sp. MMGLQ5-1]NPD36141.1 sucrose-6-phosphate hydrolase [Enterococcus sp. MMGLQ5-2]